MFTYCSHQDICRRFNHFAQQMVSMPERWLVHMMQPAIQEPA